MPIYRLLIEELWYASPEFHFMNFCLIARIVNIIMVLVV